VYLKDYHDECAILLFHYDLAYTNLFEGLVSVYQGLNEMTLHKFVSNVADTDY
jgi:hypothetical protein